MCVEKWGKSCIYSNYADIKNKCFVILVVQRRKDPNVGHIISKLEDGRLIRATAKNLLVSRKNDSTWSRSCTDVEDGIYRVFLN